MLTLPLEVHVQCNCAVHACMTIQSVIYVSSCVRNIQLTFDWVGIEPHGAYILVKTTVSVHRDATPLLNAILELARMSNS